MMIHNIEILVDQEDLHPWKFKTPVFFLILDKLNMPKHKERIIKLVPFNIF